MNGPQPVADQADGIPTTQYADATISVHGGHLIYVPVKDRAISDTIAMPCIDHRVKSSGHCLGKSTDNEPGTGTQPNPILQHPVANPE